MLQLEISFRAELDGGFIVLSRQALHVRGDETASRSTIFDDESTFLELMIAAELNAEETRAIAVAVILSVARPHDDQQWISLNISEEKAKLLRLNIASATAEIESGRESEKGPGLDENLPLPIFNNAALFHDFLMNAPTPFVMLAGPRHIFTFINPPYVQLLGRTSSKQLLGFPVREALPEPGFAHCLSILQKAYDTGTPQVRKELLNCFWQEDTGRSVEAYFDIVYQPVRDGDGKVTGIMAQATDVTERVLARQVSEHREQKLYRLWAELESIYAAAPTAIAVVDVHEFKFLRLNERQAELFGQPRESLLNRPLSALGQLGLEIIALLKRAANGETIVDAILDSAVHKKGSIHDYRSVSIGASRSPAGAIESLTLVTLDRSRSAEPACATV